MGINPQAIEGYASSIIYVINYMLVPALIALAFIVFLWGVYLYFIYGADNEEKRKEGRTFTLYGVIGMVIIFSLWGIVNIFMSTLGLFAGGNSPPPPTIFGGSGYAGTGGFVSPGSGYGNVGNVFGGGGTPFPGGGDYRGSPGGGTVAEAQAKANAAYDVCLKAGSTQSVCGDIFKELYQRVLDGTTGFATPEDTDPNDPFGTDAGSTKPDPSDNPNPGEIQPGSEWTAPNDFGTSPSQDSTPPPDF